MRVERFIEARMPAWRQLEAVAQAIDRRRGGGAPDAGERLLRLYQQATADLASLRTMEADPSVIRWLNRLVVRVHGLIYRGRRARGRFSIVRFFARDYPRLFRAAWPQMLASFALCVVVYALAFEAVQSDPLLIADILGGMEGEFSGAKTPEDITERFLSIERSGMESVAASAITTNNIKVALVAFAMGITLGLGTAYMLIVNAAMLGGIAGAFARSGIESALWMTVLPHGALELSAIVIAGGAGFVIGWSIWRPGERTRRRALQEEATKATLLAVGLIPAFIVAGVIEGFITPSTAIPQGGKVALGVAVAAVFWAYLFLGGRTPDTDEADATARASAAA